MNLLFDQNISYKIVKRIEDVFPASKQVRNVGLENKTYLEILEYAKSNNYCIVTFDSDFYDLSLVRGIPPKIIWLRTGNTTTNGIEKNLRDNKVMVDEFLNNPDYSEISCLELD
ncbi:MAG: DUF5615 family PIN-like protein [Bacteroidetes bacterium]|nr:DUF5615 family PIN-like protein [Bacteroidota bacterium]